MHDEELAVDMAPPIAQERRGAKRTQVALIAVLLLLVTLSHWVAPTDRPSLHVLHMVHIALQKLFVLPILLAAIWFNLRGAVASAAAATVLYLPYVLGLSGEWGGEHLDQASEIVNLWIVAVVGGLFIQREKTALRQVARSIQGALESLVSALDAREHETERHSKRVQDMAERVAGKMNLAGKNLLVLRQAALLHDVGKIGIPDAILLKPGPLTDQEANIMRQHSEIGCRIIEVVPGLQDVAQAIHAHHEWFNGTGYPQRLKDGQIPPAARIFAVADVYDALTSDRPYRAGMSADEARRVIRSESGTHFDPAVVDAFLRVVGPGPGTSVVPDAGRTDDQAGNNRQMLNRSLSQRMPAGDDASRGSGT